jgi:hypothetical protein
MSSFDREAWSIYLKKVSEYGATDYERRFIPLAARDWAENNWVNATILVAVYLLFCKYGVEFMKSRKAWDLRYPLAAWSALLSLFSFIGVFRTVNDFFLLHAPSISLALFD